MFQLRTAPGGRGTLAPGVLLGGLATGLLVTQLGFALSSRAVAGVHACEWLVALAHATLLAGRGGDVRRLVTRWAQGLAALGLLASLSRCLPAVEAALRTDVRVWHDALSVTASVAVAARTALDLARAHDVLLERVARPELFLAAGFLALIGAGSALLMLPHAATGSPLGPVEALFMATSASCVTGLGVVDAGTALTLRGQAILAALFQLGGLGIVTLVAFGAAVAGKRYSVQHLVRMRTLVQAESLPEVRRQVLFFVAAALAIEVLGALALHLALPRDAALAGPRAWWCVFHSISAFCNAGFGLERDSLAPFRGLLGVNLVVIALFVGGGLGIPVLRELLRWLPAHVVRLARPRVQRRFVPPLSIQAKLALAPTVALLLAGALGFWLLERQGALADLGGGEAALAALFQGATPRTAGFSTLDHGAFSDATLLFVTGLMVVGASPMSTGGGIKTATMMVLLLTLRAAVREREDVEFDGRVIARAAVRTALSVLLLYVATAALGVLVVSITDAGVPLRDRIFEVVSALSTTGLSTGVTAGLSTAGKLVLCALMFLGRVGPATLMLGALSHRGRVARYHYPKAPVILG